MALDRESGKTKTLISGEVGKVEAMSVDAYGHNLYWVDSERQTVEVFSLNTHERKVLLQDLGGESPIAIRVVPEEGLVIVQNNL